MPFIEVRDLTKRYQLGRQRVDALDGVSFTIDKGDLVVILGPSGSGKSTLLNLLGGMDLADGGTIAVDGRIVSQLSARQLNEYRRCDVGFIFQFYNLLPTLTLKENVEIAVFDKNHLDVKECLALVGLCDRANHFPAQLSGGEQQRTAIARAIVKRPKLLLCDEPTGALDGETGKLVLQTLHDLCHDNKQTVVIVTHNVAIAAIANKVIHLRDGRIRRIEVNQAPASVNEVDW